jgi:glycosyltransferase involved in cell wall biosynthesis
VEKGFISVILPSYNAEKFLADAIDSILKQTYTQFELLLIDDGSTDSTAEIISKFKDDRILYIKNEKNLGLIATLNKGIELSKGEFIARMDADDISLPQRFEKQLAYFSQQPTAAACGSWYLNFNGRTSKRIVKDDNDWLRANLLFTSCLCHPSTMIRKEVLTKNNIHYRQDYKHAEDYDLWIEISKVSKLGNVQEFLFKYRSHSQQVSEQNRTTQKSSAAIIRRNYLTFLQIPFSEEEFRIHEIIANNELIRSADELAKLEKWLLKLSVADHSPGFSAFIGKTWFDACGMTTLGISSYHTFFRSQLAQFFPASRAQKMRLLAKCAVRKYKK